MSKTLKINLFIHLFAVAHALTAILFRYMGWSDDIPLTILTIILTVAVARENDFPLDISGALALLSCFTGFFLGTEGAKILGALPIEWITKYANVITTIIITEVLGWTIYFITHKRKTQQ